nr:hypothetical protein [Pantoea sp. 201603H]
MNKINTANIALLVTLMNLLAPALAADGEADMTFHGTLIAPRPA